MLVLTNANIYTLWKESPRAEAVAIENGRFVAVGSNAEIQNLIRPGDTVRKLAGRTVIPGLTDSHIHLQHYALGLDKVDCETATLEECLRRVAAAASVTKPGVWIKGHGWNQNQWVEGFGNAAQLDQIAPNNPVYLTAKSLHASWANSAALRMAGITPQTPDPLGGTIQRGTDNIPTGILFESAMELVESVIPAASVPEIRQAIESAQPVLWRYGLTGVHDYDPRTCFLALQEMELGGSLKLRVIKGIPREDLSHAIGIGLKTGFGSDFLRIGSLKLFADGALGPQTAAMLQPYLGSSDTGMLFLDAEEIFEIGQKAAETGISLAIHAIGDRANHEVLKAFGQMRNYETSHQLPALRHRIEHVQVLHPDDLDRLAALGITASMQPIHATSDYPMADRHWGERSRSAYALGELLKRGTALTFGSDAPVESPNPFWGLHAAVTRRRHDGSPGPDGWYPQQRLTLLQALEGYTTGPAHAAGLEKRLGKIAPGFHADLLVLELDPFAVETDQLFTLEPSATMVAGSFVWEM